MFLLELVGLSVFPEFGWLFPFSCQGSFNYNLLKYFLRSSLSPLLLGSCSLNVVPEVSENILISLHSFFFILLLGSYFHNPIFQLIYSFFCFNYSALIPSGVFFISALYYSSLILLYILNSLLKISHSVHPKSSWVLWSSLSSMRRTYK